MSSALVSEDAHPLPFTKRVSFNGQKGTVLYEGPLTHPVDNPKINVNDTWLGVQWDETGTGKHDGTVGGVTYFTPQGVEEGEAQKVGSLILKKKAQVGVDFIEGLIRRYFKDHEVAEILKHKDNIVTFLKEKWELQALKYKEMQADVHDFRDTRSNPVQNLSKKTDKPKEEESNKDAKSDHGEESQTTQADKEIKQDSMFEEDEEEEKEEKEEEEEETTRNDAISKLMNKIKDKDCYTDELIAKEFDEEAFIRTYNQRFKKIELKGFDKIWERIYNLDKMIDLSLTAQNIQSFGKLGTLTNVVSSLKNLTLEDNLFHNWSQILVLGSELKNLETLSVSHNPLKADPEGYLNQEGLKSFNHDNDTFQIADPSKSFPKLKQLIAIKTKTSFKTLNCIMPFLNNLEELVLCINSCNDFENIQPQLYQKLDAINLEANNISDESDFSNLCSFKSLTKLAMNQNKISRFLPKSENKPVFVTLKNLNISDNNFHSGLFFKDLREVCPTITSLKCKNIPLEAGFKVPEGIPQTAVTQLNRKELVFRAIGELRTLAVINGWQISKFDRRDGEYYLLRWVFHEYFDIFNKHQMNYKFKEFEAWAKQEYPIVFELIEMHENPYPEVGDDVSKDDPEYIEALKAIEKNAKTMNTSYVNLRFTLPVGKYSETGYKKRFPKTIDFYYIKNWAQQTFPEVKEQANLSLKYRNPEEKIFSLVEDLSKDINYYCLGEGATILIDFY